MQLPILAFRISLSAYAQNRFIAYGFALRIGGFQLLGTPNELFNDVSIFRPQ